MYWYHEVKMSEQLQVATFALAVILTLEGFALHKGVDGAMFGAAMAAVGGIVGYMFKSFQIKQGRR